GGAVPRSRGRSAGPGIQSERSGALLLAATGRRTSLRDAPRRAAAQANPAQPRQPVPAAAVPRDPCPSAGPVRRLAAAVRDRVCAAPVPACLRPMNTPDAYPEVEADFPGLTAAELAAAGAA